MSFSQALQSQLTNLKQKTEKPMLPGKSTLLFNFKDAANINNEEAYYLGLHGLLTLSKTNYEFKSFISTLFISTAKYYNRETKLKEETDKVDSSINSLLPLLTCFFENNSCHKIIEFLLRVYQINLYNSDALILSFLPYHNYPSFIKLIQNIGFSNKHIHGGFGFLEEHTKSGKVVLKDNLYKNVLRDFDLLIKIVDFCDKSYIDNSNNTNLDNVTNYCYFIVELLIEGISYYSSSSKNKSLDNNNFIRVVVSFISNVISKYDKINSNNFHSKFLEMILLLVNSFSVSEVLVKAISNELFMLSFKLENLISNDIELDFDVLSMNDNDEEANRSTKETAFDVLLKTILALIMEIESKKKSAIEEKDIISRNANSNKGSVDANSNLTNSFASFHFVKESLLKLNSSIVIRFIEEYSDKIAEFSYNYNIVSLIREFALSSSNVNTTSNGINEIDIQSSLITIISKINLTKESLNELILVFTVNKQLEIVNYLIETNEESINNYYLDLILTKEKENNIIYNNNNNNTNTYYNYTNTPKSQISLLLRDSETALTKALKVNLDSGIINLSRDIFSSISLKFNDAVNQLDTYFKKELETRNRDSSSLKDIAFSSFFLEALGLRFIEKPINVSSLNTIINMTAFNSLLSDNGFRIEMIDFVIREIKFLFNDNTKSLKNSQNSNNAKFELISNVVAKLSKYFSNDDDTKHKDEFNSVIVCGLLLNTYLENSNTDTNNTITKIMEVIANNKIKASTIIKKLIQMTQDEDELSDNNMIISTIANQIINSSNNSISSDNKHNKNMFFTILTNYIEQESQDSLYSNTTQLSYFLKKEIQYFNDKFNKTNTYNNDNDIKLEKNNNTSVTLPILDLVFNNLTIAKETALKLINNNLLNLIFSNEIIEYTIIKILEARNSKSNSGLNKLSYNLVEETAYQSFFAFLILNDVIDLNNSRVIDLLTQVIKNPYSGIKGISLYSASKQSRSNNSNSKNNVQSVEVVFILSVLYAIKKNIFSNDSNISILKSLFNLLEFNSSNSNSNALSYSPFYSNTIFNDSTNIKKIRNTQNVLKSEDKSQMINEITSIKRSVLLNPSMFIEVINKQASKILFTIENICLKELSSNNNEDEFIVKALINLYSLISFDSNNNNVKNNIDMSAFKFSIDNYVKLLSLNKLSCLLFEEIITNIVNIKINGTSNNSNNSKSIEEIVMSIISYQNKLYNDNNENNESNKKKIKLFSESFIDFLLTTISIASIKLKPEQFLEIILFTQYYPTVFNRIKEYTFVINEDKVLSYIANHTSYCNNYKILYLVLETLKFENKTVERVTLLFSLINKNKLSIKEGSNYDYLNNLLLIINSLVINISVKSNTTNSNDSNDTIMKELIDLVYYIVDIISDAELKELKRNGDMEVDDDDDDLDKADDNNAVSVGDFGDLVNGTLMSCLHTLLKSVNIYYTINYSKVDEKNNNNDNYSSYINEVFFSTLIKKTEAIKLSATREKVVNTIINFTLENSFEMIIENSNCTVNNNTNESKSNKSQSKKPFKQSTNASTDNNTLIPTNLSKYIQKNIHYLTASLITILNIDYNTYLNNSLNFILNCFKYNYSSEGITKTQIDSIKIGIITQTTVTIAFINTYLSKISEDKTSQQNHLLRNSLIVNFFSSPEFNSLLVFVKENIYPSYGLRLNILNALFSSLISSKLDSNTEIFCVSSNKDSNNNADTTDNVVLVKEVVVDLCFGIYKSMEKELPLVISNNETDSNLILIFSNILNSISILSNQTYMSSSKILVNQIQRLEQYVIERAYSYDLIEELIMNLISHENETDYTCRLNTTNTLLFLSQHYLELIITDSSLRVKTQSTRVLLVKAILENLSYNKDLISNWEKSNNKESINIVNIELYQVFCAIITKFVVIQETYSCIKENFSNIVEIIIELESTTNKGCYYNKSIVLNSKNDNSTNIISNTNNHALTAFKSKQQPATFQNVLYLKFSLLLFTLKVYSSFPTKTIEKKLIEDFDEVLQIYLNNLFEHEYLESFGELNTLMIISLEELSKHSAKFFTKNLKTVATKLLLDKNSNKFKQYSMSILINCAKTLPFSKVFKAIKSVVKSNNNTNNSAKNSNIEILIKVLSKSIALSDKLVISEFFNEINQFFFLLFKLIENSSEESLLTLCSNAYSSFILRINQKQLSQIFNLILDFGFSKKTKEQLENEKSGIYEDSDNDDNHNNEEAYLMRIGRQGSVLKLKSNYNLKFTGICIIMLNVIVNTIQSLFIPYFEKYQLTFLSILKDVIQELTNLSNSNNRNRNITKAKRNANTMITSAKEANNKSNNNSDSNNSSDVISDELEIDADDKKLKVSLLGKKIKHIQDKVTANNDSNDIFNEDITYNELPLKTEFKNPLILNTLLLQHLELLFKNSSDKSIDYRFSEEIVKLIPCELQLELEETFYYNYYNSFIESCLVTLFSEIKDSVGSDEYFVALNENVLALTKEGNFITKLLVLRLVSKLYDELSERYLIVSSDTSDYIKELVEDGNENVSKEALILLSKINAIDGNEESDKEDEE